MPVNSAIGFPATGPTIKRDSDGLVQVRGYALPGYQTGPIILVPVSADDGTTWQDAELYIGVGECYKEWDLKLWCL